MPPVCAGGISFRTTKKGGKQMRIAFVADLHGNWPATQAVALDIEARGIEDVYCLGDMIGKGPSSKLTFDWALSRCKVVLAGNWDLFIAENREPDCQYYCDQLAASDILAIRQLPFSHAFWFSGQHIRLLHGRPLLPLITPFEDERKFDAFFQAGNETFTALGYADIHQPGFRILSNSRYVFNTGSVGNALKDTRAHYAILSGEIGEAKSPFSIEMVSIDYDREQAIADAQASPHLPNRGAYIREIQTGIYSR